MVKLADILKYYQPNKFIVKSENYSSENKTPVLTAGKSFILGYTNETDSVFTDLPAIIFDDFTTAFHYVDFPFKVKSSAMKILVARNDEIDLKYVYYRMKGLKVDTDLHKRYWISKYSLLKLPLPSFETQKRIAQILDDAQALKQKTEQLLKEYDNLAQAIFLDMFGDPVKNPKGWNIDILGNRVEKIQIGPFGSQLHQSDYVDEGIDLINPTNIKEGNIDYNNSVKITQEKYVSLPNYHLQIGDIIMARRGDLSKIGIVNRANTFCGTGSLYIRLRNDINTIFGFWLLSHKSTVDKLYEKAQGITMANLNKKIITNLQIVVPPISIQNQFAEKIALIDKQKELARQELKESEDLFNCLLQKAFKGEL